MQLRTAVAELMAAVRALPPLSMDAVGAAARLALPQIGCSNPRRAFRPVRVQCPLFVATLLSLVSIADHGPSA